MAKDWFFPHSKVGRLDLLKCLGNNLPGGLATKYGITLAQTKDIQDSAAFLEYLSKTVGVSDEFGKSLTACYEEIGFGTSGVLSGVPVFVAPTPLPTTVPAPGIFNRVIDLANVIKNHPSYTTTDGEALGIEGADAVGKKEADLQPELKVQVMGSNVQVSAVKGDTQGFEVWCNKGTNTFVFVGFATGSKFKDPSPLPAQAAIWKYKGIYHLHNEQVGQWSQEVSVNVGG